MKNREIYLSDRMILTLNEFTLKGEPDECWPWIGFRHKLGYGIMTGYTPFLGSELYLAHRVAYVCYKGPFPWELQVCHTCDHPYCVNPNHLVTGTNKDNMNDRDNKGRNAKGEKHGMAKLKQADVDRIRDLSARGIIYRVIAEEFNITECTVSRIVRNETWIQ